MPIKVPQVSSLHRLAGHRPAVLPQVNRLSGGITTHDNLGVAYGPNFDYQYSIYLFLLTYIELLIFILFMLVIEKKTEVY